MTPREKLIEKVAEVFYNSEEYNSTYGYPDSSFEEDKKDEANECVRRRVYVAKTIAKNIIDYLKIEAVDNDADNFRAKRKGLNVININNLGIK